ncbi:MAG: hypothetical protein ACK58L_10815 [Planctomycetota bacterium]
MTRHWAQILMLCVLLVPVSGCSSANSFFTHPAQLVKDPGRLIGRPKMEQHVVRIVSLWEAANGKDPDGKPARGFAGQILFFGPDSQTGVRVKGKIVVYEYDEYDPESLDEPDPIHSFTFEPDAWDLHRTEGTLGHSYSCFIPYMKRHRNQVNCGLKVDFINEQGQRVSSDIVEVLLPSRSASSAAAAMTRGFVREKQLGMKPAVEQASHEKTQPQSDDNKLESVSIPLPRR